MYLSLKTWWIEHRKNIVILLWVYFILQILLYLPYLLPVEFLESIRLNVTSPMAFLRFYDGPFYVGVARTMYESSHPYFNAFSYHPVLYYTNHFPLFPVIIRAISILAPFSMAGLLANQIMSIAGLLVLYRVYLHFMNSREALVLSFAQILIPARSLVWHHVTNSEPTVLFFVALSILLILKKKWWWALVVAIFIQLTRPFMILLFPGFFLVALLEEKGKVVKAISTLLVPLTFITVQVLFSFIVPGFSFTDRPGGFLSVMGLTPFLNYFALNFSADSTWYLMVTVFAGLYMLYIKGKTNKDYWRLGLLWVPFIYATLFIIHHDVSRYLWPSLPFVLFIPLKDLFLHRAMRVAVVIMIPALLLASWGVLADNQMPIEHFIMWLKALGE